ncbi:TPA: hypothetical protein DCL30_01370 [Candidatus Peribacteria bacterium]|nr:hypothetical protein [Candidatus Peribacteria bacterium]HAS34542.1 hypothetical protein [Candidatus Peribacteria bacterium]
MTSSGFQTRFLGDDTPPPRPARFGGLKRATGDGRFRRFGRMLARAFWAVLRVTKRILSFFAPQRTGSLRKSLLRIGGAVLLLFFLYTGFLWFTLPDVGDSASLIASQSTVITDRNGEELYRLFSEEDRTYIPSSSIPQSLKDAIVAIEDERFYERGCLDMRAIFRVFFRFGQAGGASTLTRQLARNALDLKKENLFNRKFKEIILGCQLEARYSKEQLLELYLNWIPFGQNAYGIEQASRRYFGVSAKDLTLAQSAILAALPQRPTYFNPYGSHLHTRVEPEVIDKVLSGTITRSNQIADDEVTIGLLGTVVGSGTTALYVGGRTDQVLSDMQDQESITEQQRLQALADIEKIAFKPFRETIRAPHFVLWVRDEMGRMFGGSEEGVLERGGLRVETTLDWKMQQVAEQVITNHREDILKRFGAQNMALVAADPQTREVLAYVGNVDYSDESNGGKIDMAIAPRQPGSSFKPFVYAAAFRNGFNPATILYDVPTKIGNDEPVDYDGKTMGLMTIRQALGASRNIPAVKAFFLAGQEEPILQLAGDMGAPTPGLKRQEMKLQQPEFDYGWPLALGAAETPLTEMVQGYSTFAAGGLAAPLVRIRRITDKKGNILFEAKPQEPKAVLDPRIAYQITSVLSDEWARPTDYWKTQLTVPGYQTAAKTGTSNKCLERKDDGSCKLRKPDNAWVIGYTPNLIAGVWAGNADSSSMYEKADGLTTMSPVWKEFMTGAHRLLKNPQTTFPAPSGIVQPQISLLSGQLPTACTPVELRRADVFLEEAAPTEPDPACMMLRVDKVTHLLASSKCPLSAQGTGSFLQAHSILPDRWPTWEEGVQKWVKVQNDLWYATEDHSGSLLPLPVAPEQECDPALTPGRLTQPTLSILSPSNGGIVGYPAFKIRLAYTVGSSVQEVRYSVDGKSVASSVEPPFDRFLRMPRSVKKEGSHIVTVTLIDRYYNEASDSLSIRFGEDRGLPVVQFSEPVGDIAVKSGDTLTVRAEAEDSDGEIKYVQFYLGQTLLTTKPREPYEFSYVVAVPDGTYQLRAVAEDMAENTAEDSLTVTVGAGGSALKPPAPIGEPQLVSPLEDQTIQKSTPIDLKVQVPRLSTQDYASLKLSVADEQGVEDVLLELTNGEGLYVRQWQSKRAGTFVIYVRTKNRSGEEREWSERKIVVE